jgi:anthranilate phosphoribosyltransferase
MNSKFNKYIKAVGTGAKHNCDLKVVDMENAMQMMLEQSAYPEQISAFLLGWRVKTETTEEFIGALNAFDKYIKKEEIKNSIEFGYPYDGKRNNPYLFPLIAKIIQKFNINIVVTGDELQPAKNGLTVKQISQYIKNIKNIYYFDRYNIFQELSKLTAIRTRLGIRTGLNTLERLINPSLSKYALIGVFHKPFMQKYAKIFGNRYDKLAIVKGNEGTAEIYSKCQYWIIQGSKTIEYKIDPKYFGINYTKSWNRISLEDSVKMFENPDEQLYKLAKLNAALVLYIFNKTSSVKEGYDILE